ncbi:reverse transcriptase family protein [Maritalea sp. S77]|uniref:reverse transcriptase family protein n=1 Tax=Maritalea sp. S77 TaxID=3415125 RepID=UPI003C7E27E9
MNKRQFSHILAESLILGDWSVQNITDNLTRNLPKDAHKFATETATELHFALPQKFAPSARAVELVLLRTTRFEATYKHCREKKAWPRRDLSSPMMCPTPAFKELDIPKLPTIANLADWLSLSENRLLYLADIHRRYEEHGETSINHYHYLLKKKKAGGTRIVEAPKEDLKAVQRQILQNIIGVLPSHPAAFGFVKGRNCLQAANRHVGEQIVLCFDLKDFFPSIGAGRIFGLFRCLGYPHAVARALTSLCTTLTPARILERLSPEDRLIYNSPHLPQGAPTSPALANHVCFSLDKRLATLAGRLGANYSRYADDLTFSGDKNIIGPLKHLLPEIVQDVGFALNQTKTRVMRHASQQVVTGVVVNEHLNIARKTFDHLKAIIHACGKPDDHRLLDPAFRSSLVGKIDWVEAANPNRGQKLRQLLADASENHL